MPSIAAENGNDPFFVDGDKDEASNGAKHGNGTSWNDETGAKFSVHDEGLADEEGGELGE